MSHWCGHKAAREGRPDWTEADAVPWGPSVRSAPWRFHFTCVAAKRTLAGHGGHPQALVTDDTNTRWGFIITQPRNYLFSPNPREDTEPRVLKQLRPP